MKKRTLALFLVVALLIPAAVLAQEPVQEPIPQEELTSQEQEVMALMEALFSTEDAMEQIEMLLEAAEAAPDNFDMQMSCAQLLALMDATGEYAQRCEEMTRRALELAQGEEQRTMARQLLVDLLMNAGKSEEALAFAQEANEDSPNNEGLELSLAAALYTAGNREEGRALVEEILEDSPQNLQARVMYGNMLLDDCRWDEALAAFQQIEEEWPMYLDGLYGQEAVYVASGQFDQAVRTIDRMIGMGGEEGLWLERARVRLWNLYLPEQVIEETDALLRLDPAWIDVYMTKLGALLYLKRYEEAHAVAEDIAAMDQDVADAMHGIVYINEKKWDEAQTVTEALTQRNPNMYLGWRNLSIARLDGFDDAAGAMEAMQNAFAAAQGGTIDLYNQLGWVYIRQNEWVEAARCFAAADRSVMDDATGLFYLAMIQIDMGREEALREYVGELDRRYPGWYETMMAHVHMEDALGNHQAALDAYEAVLEKFPFEAQMQPRLGPALRLVAGDETGLAEIEALLVEYGDDATIQDWDAYAFMLARSGDTQEAQKMLAHAKTLLDEETPYAGMLRNDRISLLVTEGEIAFAMGDIQACVEAFGQAAELGWSIRSVTLDEYFAPLLEDEGFQTLLQQQPPLPDSWDDTQEPTIPQN